MKYLDVLGAQSREAFVSDFHNYASAERFLQIAIEAISDLGSHVIAEQSLGSIESYRDIPRRLREANIIGDDLLARWQRMVGFRNILVHGYLGVNRSTVYDIVQDDLNDIRAIRDLFARYLT